MMTLLIEAALRALLVALAVLTGLRLFRMSNVPAQKAAWGLVLLSAIAMPVVMKWQVLPASIVLHIPAARWSHAPETAPTAIEPILPSNIPQEPAAAIDLPSPHRKSILASTPVRAPEPLSTPSGVVPEPRAPARSLNPAGLAAFLSLAAFLYLAVAAILVSRLFWGLACAIRLWCTSETYQADYDPRSASLQEGFPAVRFSFAISSPVTIGSGILLPADCLTWDREKLSIVLAHERSHVRQGDFYLQILAGLYTAVYWFSPLGWWLQRKLSDLAEAIGDRAGLEQAASRASYAQVLLEFAALPRPTDRPTILGVAMARSSNLSQRIERFLDESTFRRAFAASPRRILVSTLLVPVALFAGIALVSVQAAQTVAPPPAPAAAPSPASAPEPAVQPTVSEPAAEASPAPSPDALPMPAPAPPPPPAANDSQDPLPAAELAEIKAEADAEARDALVLVQDAHGYSRAYSRNGDSYALVGGSGDNLTFSGDWDDQNRELIEKARKQAHGKFIWLRHNGKSYIIDDPAVVARFEALQRPLHDLSLQQQKFAKEMEEMARNKEYFALKFDEAKIPTPDISKQMAELNAAVAKLDAKKGSTVSPEQLAELQAKLGEIQGRLGALQGLTFAQEAEIGKAETLWGDKEGKLGAMEGRLGAQEGKLS